MIGLIVHFVEHGPRQGGTVCLPGIVTALAHPDRDDGSEEDLVLTVFPGGTSHTASHDEVCMPPGSWHRPVAHGGPGRSVLD